LTAARLQFLCWNFGTSAGAIQRMRFYVVEVNLLPEVTMNKVFASAERRCLIADWEKEVNALPR
jgi:hypothetical protein